MTITGITLTLDSGETVSGSISEDYGWQQWGAVEATLYKTVPFWDGLTEAAQDNDRLASLLGWKFDEDEEEDDDE